MNKLLLSIIIAFAVGFASSHFIFNSAQNSVRTVDQCPELSQAKSYLMSLSQKEYLEYTQIKDLKQKYEKADELLGKIMVLFLADVGFRLKKPMTTEVLTTPDKPSKEPTPSGAAQALNESKPEMHSPAVTTGQSGLSGKSSIIKNLADEKQVAATLGEALIENPKIEVAKGIAPNLQQRRLLEGRYTGFIRFLQNKREALNVVWDLSPDYSKNRFAGAFTLSIHGTSLNSESNGQGTISSIISLAEDTNGFLVNGCGGDCYLQLYYNTPADQFFGNFYQAVKGSSKFERTGLISLKK